MPAMASRVEALPRWMDERTDFLRRDLDVAPPATAVSVVIPIYNEEASVATTIRLVHAALARTERVFEIIVVNDGSTDDSEASLRHTQGVKLLQHDVNRGYGASLKTGLQHARYPLIAIVDGDGTYPIERLPLLIELADSECDMAVGARIGSFVHQPWLRRLPKAFLRRFAEWLTDSVIPDLNSGMRVFRKAHAERFLHLLPNGFSFTSTITMALLVHRLRVEFVPIDYHRRVGRSKIRPIRDTINFFQLILRTAFYFAPLRVFLPIAFLFFILLAGTLTWDMFVLQDLTDRSLLLLTAATQLGMFALLADLIHKRTMSV